MFELDCSSPGFEQQTIQQEQKVAVVAWDDTAVQEVQEGAAVVEFGIVFDTSNLAAAVVAGWRKYVVGDAD